MFSFSNVEVLDGVTGTLGIDLVWCFLSVTANRYLRTKKKSSTKLEHEIFP